MSKIFLNICKCVFGTFVVFFVLLTNANAMEPEILKAINEIEFSGEMIKADGNEIANDIFECVEKFKTVNADTGIYRLYSLYDKLQETLAKFTPVFQQFQNLILTTEFLNRRFPELKTFIINKNIIFFEDQYGLLGNEFEDSFRFFHECLSEFLDYDVNSILFLMQKSNIANKDNNINIIQNQKIEDILEQLKKLLEDEEKKQRLINIFITFGNETRKTVNKLSLITKQHVEIFNEYFQK